MYELFAKINRSTLSFGLFTTEWIQQAKEDLQRAYPNAEIYAEESEYDVLRIHRIDKPFQMIDYNEYK